MTSNPDEIRSDIEQTRSEMSNTLDALGYKANVPARTKRWIGRKRQTVTGACSSGMSSAAATSSASMVLPVPGSPLTSSGRCKVAAAFTASIKSWVAT